MYAFEVSEIAPAPVEVPATVAVPRPLVVGLALAPLAAPNVTPVPTVPSIVVNNEEKFFAVETVLVSPSRHQSSGESAATAVA
ncbi:unannotated protein [freshwater metagenome]|uniref:Unannotated protein n=1 Tax=freshwater metagenome TaxID=449393 RepID=A0A6J7BIS1_9ZZZZ